MKVMIQKIQTAFAIHFVMPRFSQKYKRHNHPIIVRIGAIWRVLTCRNFILIDFKEFEENGQKGRSVRPLYRSDYDAESDFLTLKAAMLMKSASEV
jgi:hypothetical protein